MFFGESHIWITVGMPRLIRPASSGANLDRIHCTSSQRSLILMVRDSASPVSMLILDTLTVIETMLCASGARRRNTRVKLRWPAPCAEPPRIQGRIS